MRDLYSQTDQIKMNILSLPEDATILLFRQFSLQEQIRLRLVCTSWNSVITRLCSVKRTLKLFGPSRDADFYQTYVNRFNLFDDDDFSIAQLADNSLVLYGKVKKSTRALAKLFPELEKLLIYTDSNQLVIDLEWLLGEWSKTLHSLALFRMECYVKLEEADTLWFQIASIPNLRRLHLFEIYQFQVPNYQMVLPAFNQLTTFSLGDYRSSDIVPVLAKLGPGLQHLRLGPRIPCSLEQLLKLMRFNPKLASNLTKLSLSYIQPNRSTTAGSVANAKQLISCICAHFRALKYLDIKFGNTIQFTDLPFDLVNLTNLAELKLDLGLKIEPELMQTFPKLTSIKSLHLDICELLKLDTLIESIAIIFPNLEKLNLKCWNADLTTVQEEVSPLLNETQFKKLKNFNFVGINNHNI